MPIHRYKLSDFVTIQRQSFFELLEKGIIEEFSKRNSITSEKKDLKFQFYPQYYVLTPPEYNPQEAIIKNKSYTCKLFVPAQLVNLKTNQKVFKWFYIGNLPLMTKRGHFILNGATRVIVNQILRSPGLYYQQKMYENYGEKWSQKPDDSYKRFYADLICMRGTWLRIEIDKYKNIWAQTKKRSKIPIYWLLVAMGLSEKKIFKTISDSYRLLGNLSNNLIDAVTINNLLTESGFENNETVIKKTKKQTYTYVKNPPEAWQEIFKLVYAITPSNFTNLTNRKTNLNTSSKPKSNKTLTFLPSALPSANPDGNSCESRSNYDLNYDYNLEEFKNTNNAYSTIPKKRNVFIENKSKHYQNNFADEGRKWLYNKFMNPRAYDLGKQGRLAFNRKLDLNISSTQTTLTGLDLLYATDYLLKVEKGVFKIDDIDHLKNRRVRTSGELIQIQIAVGVVRLEKIIREKLNKSNFASHNQYFDYGQISTSFIYNNRGLVKDNRGLVKDNRGLVKEVEKKEGITFMSASKTSFHNKEENTKNFGKSKGQDINQKQKSYLTNVKNYDFLINLVNSKAFNSAIREFFGTSPLSQFMDQINPLAELTHKRRLSSMGPGGVTRDTATLAIRGIHPTHYGRICPIETPEGKNTGLVNSMTTYARVNTNGIIESPFYKVYKGQVQKNTGMYYFSAEQEEKIKLAAADIFVSSIGFLPKSFIPVRIAEDFTKISRSQVQFIGVSALQMISIAASLIPFLEHDDANRALMGSNMQRQAVPLIRPERPIVGTGLEARAVSDSGHSILAQFSGLVTYVSSNKIIVQTINNN